MPKPTWDIQRGDCRELLAQLAPNSVDSVITDPPYGLAYGNHEWDTFSTPRKFQEFSQQWGEAIWPALKPGGYLLSCCSAAKYHRMLVGLEDAGYRVQTTIMFIQRVTTGDRMPRVGRQIDEHLYKVKHGKRHPKGTRAPHTPEGDPFRRYGTRLAVRYEPICLVQKPYDGSLAASVLKHGCGGIRYYDGQEMMPLRNAPEPGMPGTVVFTGDLADALEADCGHGSTAVYMVVDSTMANLGDKEIGLDASFRYDDTLGDQYFRLGSTRKGMKRRNIHPTIKPTQLGRWLQRMFTPEGGVTLDPFMGSGSFGVSAVLENLQFIGMEINDEFCDIAQARIRYAEAHPEDYEITSRRWVPRRGTRIRTLV